MNIPNLNAYQLQRFIEKVRSDRGLDLNNYEGDFLRRRLLAAMLERRSEIFDEYLAILDHNPAEYNKLFSQLYINKTEFFRDPQVWSFFHEQVLRPFLKNKRKSFGEKKIRIWSAGCASGEEPYSIAMMLAQELVHEIRAWDIQIFATDMNETALAHAHRGIYTNEQLLNLPEESLSFFHSLGNDLYQADENIRGIVWFQKEDLLAMALTMAAQLDFIFCRNVMIYFTAKTQERLKMKFARLLKPDAWLILGSAEVMLGASRTPFIQVSGEHKIYQKKN